MRVQECVVCAVAGASGGGDSLDPKLDDGVSAGKFERVPAAASRQAETAQGKNVSDQAGQAPARHLQDCGMLRTRSRLLAVQPETAFQSSFRNSSVVLAALC